IREVFSSSFIQQKEMLIFRIRANGFLQYMTRNIVGSLIEVGKGKLSRENIQEALKNPDLSDLIAPTAPPQGLFLIKIEY
ncbi:MAG: tRNA pseudouridine(38-40) synthase TruA, partial [Acidobacteriota bacterium]